jgi:exodeoxyribonuclease VII large subunit
VLVRGGGSQTDLLLFDAYQLVRAIARFPIPVLTGLGHLKDVSLADLVAHSALKTPTKVAEFIVDHNASFEQKLIDLRQRLVMGVQQRLSFLQQIIDKQQNTLINHAENIISTKQRIVDNALNNVGMIEQNKLSFERSRHAVMLTQLRFLPENLIKKSLDQLHGMENLVRAYGPDAILKRGFTYVEFEGKPVNSAYKIHSGDCITIRMHDGSAYGTIQTIELYGKKERNNA